MKAIILLVIGLISVNVSAQSRFSFSGLQWGQGIDEVVTQLTRSGLPPTSTIIYKKSVCLLRGACDFDFSGQGIRGMASFEAGKLVSVHLFSESDSVGADRLQRLQNSYGPPTRSIRRMLDNHWYWESPNGELIHMYGYDGAVSYFGPQKPRGAGVKF